MGGDTRTGPFVIRRSVAVGRYTIRFIMAFKRCAPMRAMLNAQSPDEANRHHYYSGTTRTSVGERNVVAILLATSQDTASSSDVRARTEPCIIDDTCDCFDA